MSAGAQAHHGFHWWDLLQNEWLGQHSHVAAATCGAAVLITGSLIYSASMSKVKVQSAADEAFVPPSNLGIRNIFDLIGSFVQGMAKDIIGHHYAEFLPILIFIFLWTLLNNLLGMIPGLGSATDNLNTTLAMGFSVFVYYNYHGFKAHGFKYLEHFTGHLGGILLLFLGPVMFVIELISHSVRPVTLGIRLRSNMYGDHTIFGIVTELFHSLGQFLSAKFGVVGTVFGALFSAIGPVPIVILGLLVAVIQAFVFMLLTTIYIGMATAHDEH
jgi:F-type H+-transporting ATPase subunit a